MKILPFRYRIRTLLLLTVVAATVAFVVSNRRLWWPTPQESYAEIMRLGGDCEFSNKIVLVNFYGRKFTDNKFRMLESMVDLRYFDISDSDVSDSAFRSCRHLENIEMINLVSCAFSGECFKYLKNSRNLKVVSIEDTPITNQGLNLILGLPNLEQLLVLNYETSSQITEIDVALVAKHRNLKTLYIQMSHIPSGLEKELKAALPGCEIHLSEDALVDDP